MLIALWEMGWGCEKRETVWYGLGDGKRKSGVAMPGKVQAGPTTRRRLRHALGNPRQPWSAVNLRAGLAQSKGTGLLPGAQAAFLGGKPCLA